MTRPIRAPDLLVLYSPAALAHEGVSKRVNSGYRPVYYVRPDYWSSAHHEFIGRDSVETGEQSLAEVWLVTPEAYPHTFWTGRQLEIREATRVVGKAEVIQVFNLILTKFGNQSS
ncbi:M15 family metallopeptidase domain-containing protein [Burkholderia ubonensis]|uniref:M15 family metallopeptidase n=1 Tax=Burkholderia ubonensis TaxID=101571 RepID=UPI001160D136|nr:M15 family metallopeptidase [Burkholderia ubonensis]